MTKTHVHGLFYYYFVESYFILYATIAARLTVTPFVRGLLISPYVLINATNPWG
jgi:hypothetical protein